MSDEDDDVIELVPCEDCGHLVPPANLEMHRLRGCPNRKRPAQQGPAREIDRHQDRHRSATAPVEGGDDGLAQGGEGAPHLVGRRDPPQNPGFVELRRSNPSIAAAGRAAMLPIAQGRAVQEGPAGFGFPSSDPMLLATPAPHTAASSAAATSSPSSWERFASTVQSAVSGLASSISTPPGESAAAGPAGAGTAPSNQYPASRRRRQRGGAVGSMKSPPRGDVIDLLDSPEAAATAPASAAARASDVVDLADDDSDDGWSCPRCTLVNPVRSSACDACLYHRSAGPASSRDSSGGSSGSEVRSPDATRTDRLVPAAAAPLWHGHPYLQQGDDSGGGYAGFLSPPGGDQRSYVGSGAILGGVLGAAGALARGRPVARAAIDGAFGGAVGGMAVDAVLQRGDRQAYPTTFSARRHQQQAQGEERQQRYRNPPSPSQRLEHLQQLQELGHGVRTIRLPNGGSVTVSTGRRYGTTAMQGVPDPRMMELLLHQSLMASMVGGQMGGYRGSPLAGGGGGGAAGAGMTYEQLLQMFGDGTENLGAQEGQIDVLPTATVTSANPKKGQCSICLQDFDVGDSFRTLPCLHSDFHTDCIDQWLKTNAACPICKHRLGG